MYMYMGAWNDIMYTATNNVWCVLLSHLAMLHNAYPGLFDNVCFVVKVDAGNMLIYLMNIWCYVPSFAVRGIKTHY